MVNVMKAIGACLLAVGMTTIAWGHGAGYEAVPKASSVALRFAYSIGEPMADTDIVVRAPDGEPWQRGRTDGAGYFSFVPHRDGAWQVMADDGLGHEVRADISVEAGSVTTGGGPTAVRLPPMLVYGLLLASLVANGLLLARGRKSVTP